MVGSKWCVIQRGHGENSIMSIRDSKNDATRDMKTLRKFFPDFNYETMLIDNPSNKVMAEKDGNLAGVK